MAGATFGRKGVAGDGIAPPQRSAFGIARPAAEPTATDDDPYAAQRAAFLAAERARGPEAPVRAHDQHGAGGSPLAPRPVSVQPKSMAVAYLLWFLLGQIGAHRFYLGFSTSAIVQVSLLFVGWLILLSGMPIGFVGVCAGAVWVLADVFMIPGLVREANGRAQQWAVGETFA